jgi:hypothetical protein
MRYACLALLGVLIGTTFPRAQQSQPLPSGAIARLGVPRWRVPGSVMNTAFSHDERTLVVLFREHAIGARLCALI